MAELITGLRTDQVRANLAAVRDRIAAAATRAGRDPASVTLVVATKYVAIEEFAVLADAGITTVGENRAQDLAAKAATYGDRFTWEFIGHLQSRKVRQVAPLVTRIHSVSSTSVVEQLARHAGATGHPLEVLVEVNVSGEDAKSGVAPAELADYVDRLSAIDGVTLTGLMTMPPWAETPEASRRWFAALAGLAEEHDLSQLSMGTTQDFEVAVEEGATIVRVGSSIFR